MALADDVIDAVKQCYDPEIPVNVYDLGLVYHIDVGEPEGNVSIKMTLTSQNCPSAQQIPDMVRAKVEALPNVKSANVAIVWEPQWNPSMISAEGKKILKLEE